MCVCGCVESNVFFYLRSLLVCFHRTNAKEVSAANNVHFLNTKNQSENHTQTLYISKRGKICNRFYTHLLSPPPPPLSLNQRRSNFMHSDRNSSKLNKFEPNEFCPEIHL